MRKLHLATAATAGIAVGLLAFQAVREPAPFVRTADSTVPATPNTGTLCWISTANQCQPKKPPQTCFLDADDRCSGDPGIIIQVRQQPVSR